MKSFGPKKIQIPCTDQKVPFWQFFRQGRDGRALLVRPSRIPHRISKNIFATGANDFLAMLEGKIREGPFFKVQSDKKQCELLMHRIKVSSDSMHSILLTWIEVMIRLLVDISTIISPTKPMKFNRRNLCSEKERV